MVFFTIKGENGEYPQVVLNGKHFYLKAQEVVFGKSRYREYATLSENLDDLEVEVLDIDIDSSEINRVVSRYFSERETATSFHPLYDSTIDKHYEKLFLEQSFDFYQNLCDAYGRKEIADIVYGVIFENLSKKWIAGYLALDEYEMDFILDNLAVYYNYIDFSGREELWPRSLE